MKVEVWTDMICPFCYIGKRRFEAGLEKLAHPETVEIVYRSFELNPHIQVNPLDDITGMAAARQGSTREHMKALQDDISKRAEQDGLKFNYDTAKPTNTLNAHRLLQFAMQFGKADDVIERLYQAYFTDSLYLDDLSILVDIAIQAGLDGDDAAEMLASDRFHDEVRADELAARRVGIRGVPYFVINDKYGISGAQPAEVFVEALQQAWKEENPYIPFKSTSVDPKASLCEDGTCEV
ncbi:putative DsbA family dithiol-disulfide isomerase [Paenibacillus endophyticus]|uniref:Putative DsbA family dithiol-disulfide isomerase n=1 Tax=Paenibacillus endophyticus TaxID=1294268 RepID=A0A7W5CEN7_9BACL|nr:DsbA family oxidoreductase [Paenibacillus endophyticus]MBB3155880.1 putative DsbA family dithiol-disulfide isomerase [Paenibacillus endophyticus]